MSRFDGKLCPVCLKRFQENDDIIVCPECGTPHHRECYFEKSRCALEDLHGSFSWEGKLPEQYESMAGEEKTPEIPVAVKIDSEPNPNDLGAAFELLEKLTGADIDENGILYDLSEYSGNAPSEPELDDKVRSELNILFDMNMLIDTEDQLYSDKPIRDILSSRKKGRHGVSMLELSFFTGMSLMHYVVPFLRFTRSKQTKGFNLSSGILMPVHQFFRKMDGWGLILLLLIGLLEAAPYILLKVGLVDMNFAQYLPIIAKIPLVIAVVLLWRFGDYLYYRHAVKRILKVRKRFEGKTDSVEYYLAIKDEGGTSTLRGIVAILAVWFVFVFIHVDLFPQ